MRLEQNCLRLFAECNHTTTSFIILLSLKLHYRFLNVNVPGLKRILVILMGIISCRCSWMFYTALFVFRMEMKGYWRVMTRAISCLMLNHTTTSFHLCISNNSSSYVMMVLLLSTQFLIAPAMPVRC